MHGDDSAITRVRQARHEISEEQAHDPERIVAYYLEMQSGTVSACLNRLKQMKRCKAPNRDRRSKLQLHARTRMRFRLCRFRL